MAQSMKFVKPKKSVFVAQQKTFSIFKPHRQRTGIRLRFFTYNKCPSFSRFVFRYFSLCGFDFILMGTCWTIFKP